MHVRRIIYLNLLDEVLKNIAMKARRSLVDVTRWDGWVMRLSHWMN
jgi:hypothetical protein